MQNSFRRKCAPVDNSYKCGPNAGCYKCRPVTGPYKYYIINSVHYS